MCYTPNVIVGNRFRGGLKKWVKENDISEEILRKRIGEGGVKIIPCGQCFEELGRKV